jgi:hypothetical protein
MANGQEPEHRWVTNKELKEGLDEKPSRHEVRFLILLAIVANQVLPTVDKAQAAVHLALGAIT